MAGRGRGRGRSSIALTADILGVNKEDLQEPVLTEEAVYPERKNKPLPLISDPNEEYVMAVKKDFIEFLHDSPFYVKLDETKHEIERYSDRYQVNASRSYAGYQIRYDLLPKELHPSSCPKPEKKKRKLTVPKPNVHSQKKSRVDLNQLDELEKKEAEEANGSQEVREDINKSFEEVEDEEEDQDEEMDEGTDYVNNYFDNGEDYLDDDDDNRDDGYY